MADSERPINRLPSFTRSRVGGWLSILVLLALILSLVFAVWQSNSDSGPREPGAVTSTPPEAERAGPAGGAASPTEAETSTTPSSATPSRSAPPSHWDGSDAGKGNSHHDNLTGTLSPWEPRSDRKPAKTDTVKAKAVLEQVVPAWANADLSDDTSAGHWIKTWSGKSGSSGAFVGQSNTRYLSLWRGAIQSNASVRGSKIISAKPLWNAGSDSLWRVTVRRQVVSNLGNKGFGGPEEVTWDFQVRQDKPEGFELVNFLDPSKANEKPRTYDPEADE